MKLFPYRIIYSKIESWVHTVIGIFIKLCLFYETVSAEYWKDVVNVLLHCLNAVPPTWDKICMNKLSRAQKLVHGMGSNLPSPSYRELSGLTFALTCVPLAALYYTEMMLGGRNMSIYVIAHNASFPFNWQSLNWQQLWSTVNCLSVVNLRRSSEHCNVRFEASACLRGGEECHSQKICWFLTHYEDNFKYSSLTLQIMQRFWLQSLVV